MNSIGTRLDEAIAAKKTAESQVAEENAKTAKALLDRQHAVLKVILMELDGLNSKTDGHGDQITVLQEGAELAIFSGTGKRLTISTSYTGEGDRYFVNPPLFSFSFCPRTYTTIQEVVDFVIDILSTPAKEPK